MIMYDITPIAQISTSLPYPWLPEHLSFLLIISGAIKPIVPQNEFILRGRRGSRRANPKSVTVITTGVIGR
jgi:hypothetical protein